jgi:hypothetical protein
MRGTGAVGVNGQTVYAYFTEERGTVRLRLSLDEGERLGLVEGLRVRLAFRGSSPADVLLVRAVAAPPFVWYELEIMSPRLTTQAG